MAALRGGVGGGAKMGEHVGGCLLAPNVTCTK